MCINSIFFYNSYFFFIKYLFLFKFFNKFEVISFSFLKKSIKWSNYFISYKFFIINNKTQVFLKNNKMFTFSRKLARTLIIVPYLTNYFNYKVFFSFFFFSFYNNYKVFFSSFKFFFTEFTNFMSYIYDPFFFFFFNKLNVYYRNKKHRKQLVNIFKFFWKKYKFNILMLFDYKYSNFFYKICITTNAFLVGFKYHSSNVNLYNYSLFINRNNILIKNLIFQQIFDIYTIALFYKYKRNVIFFLNLQNYFISL